MFILDGSSQPTKVQHATVMGIILARIRGLFLPEHYEKNHPNINKAWPIPGKSNKPVYDSISEKKPQITQFAYRQSTGESFKRNCNNLKGQFC